MSAIAEQQEPTSPKKLLHKAKMYSTHLGHFHDMPKAMSKSVVVRQRAEDHSSSIDFAIQRQQFQCDLYRYKQKEDLSTRQKFEKKLEDSAVKVHKNGEEIVKKHNKLTENYNKHLKEVYKKFEDQEKRHRVREKEEAYKLRKQLKEFYEKEAERKKKAEAKQIAVGTCYQGAIDKLENIHRQNQAYSRQREHEVTSNLAKNNNYDHILRGKRMSQSAVNSEKQKVYDQNNEIFSHREHKHIQKYGHNEDGSIKANQHIEDEMNKTTKRIGEFLKKRVEEWSGRKKRVESDKVDKIHKYSSILDKKGEAMYRTTVSSFRQSAVEWGNTVKRNKSAIREYDESKKDEIMAQHLDMRLKNNSSFQVHDRLESMRKHARKVTHDYV